MSCNSCAKGFSLLRPEKGCPGCGFSFCSKCLNNKVFLPKLNSEAKVCAKCKKSSEQEDSKNQTIPPPDAYYKRMAEAENKSAGTSSTSTMNTQDLNVDDQIQERLKKLKENKEAAATSASLPGASVSDAEISERLAKLRGTPVVVNKPVLVEKDLRTEQEQANDLVKQYVEETQIDTKYQNEFESHIKEIEGRMMKLKGTCPEKTRPLAVSLSGMNTPPPDEESEDEEESLKQIVEKLKAELLEDNPPATHNELPFCEICNEDAVLRCLGCMYLYCKQCYKDHRDDDDGCNRCEPYDAPKEIQN